MKLITRDTDYAVRALISIANSKDKMASAAALVKELKIPQPFLRKILQILNKSGILHSHKGNKGGFVLGRPIEEIYVADLMRIFQGDLKINECIFRKKLCPNRMDCVLRAKISTIERDVIKKLKTINLASLLLK